MGKDTKRNNKTTEKCFENEKQKQNIIIRIECFEKRNEREIIGLLKLGSGID